MEKEIRVQRIKQLLDSDSEEDEKNFDYKAMHGGKLKDFLGKIENHVSAEQKILDAWNEKDSKIRSSVQDNKSTTNNNKK